MSLKHPSRFSTPRASRLGRTLAACTLLASLAVLAGCHRYPAPPRYPEDDPQFSETLDLRPKGMDELPPEPTRVLAGDEVDVRMISATETVYSGLTVDELGNLHLPLAGDVEVSGLTLSEAERRVEKAMREYDAVVRVSLRVSAPTGHRATVVGAVQSPGVITVTPGMRLAELLAQAGGPVISDGGPAAFESADIYLASLLRDGEALPVSLPLAMQGDPRHNVRVRPGDHLYVPRMRGNTITVLGETGNQLMLYRPHMRLSQVLAVAGGVPITGRMRDVRVIRGRMDQPKIYKVSERALGRGEAVDVELAPGDIIFVGRRSMTEFNAVMTALGPFISTGVGIGVSIGVNEILNDR